MILDTARSNYGLSNFLKPLLYAPLLANADIWVRVIASQKIVAARQWGVNFCREALRCLAGPSGHSIQKRPAPQICPIICPDVCSSRFQSG